MLKFGKRRYNVTKEFSYSSDARFELPLSRSGLSHTFTLSSLALIGVGVALALGSAWILLRSGPRAIASEERPAPVPVAYVLDGAPTKAAASVQHASQSLASRCAQQADRIRETFRRADATGDVRLAVAKAIIDCHLSINPTDLCDPFHRWRLGRQTAAYLDEYFDDRFLSRLNVEDGPSPLTAARHMPPDVRRRLREFYSFGLLSERDLTLNGRSGDIREAFRLVVGGARVHPLRCPGG